MNQSDDSRAEMSSTRPDPRTPFQRFQDAARVVFNVPKAAVDKAQQAAPPAPKPSSGN